MTNSRRVALVLIAAQLLAAPLAFAQQNRQGAGQSGNAGGSNDDEEDDEEEPPARGNQGARPQGNAAPPAATPSRGNGGSGGSGNQAGWDFASNESEQQADARRERMLPRYSGLDGSIGLMHMQTAQAGSDQTFRFGLISEYWSGSGFLRPAGRAGTTVIGGVPQIDNASHIGSTLTLSYSPIRYMDIFASLRSYANSNDQERPRLFQVLGDTNLGIKGIYPIVRGLNVGVSAGAYLLNRAGGIGLSGDSTSFDLRALAMFDIQQFAHDVPVRVHLNLGYYFDNSVALVQGTELARRQATAGYDATICNRTPTANSMDPRNNLAACQVEITRIERYALGINRADRFSVNFGADATLWWFNPFFELNFGVPVVRSGYICWRGSWGQGDDDRCLATPGLNQFSATPSWFTIGTRFNPAPVRALSVLLALDVAMGGTSEFVRELAPTQPWTFYFGASYAHDFAPQIRRVEVPHEVIREVTRDVTPIHGVLAGQVTDVESHQAIPTAIIDFVGHPEFGLIATSNEGRYRSRDVPPGDYEIHVHAADHFDNNCRATIPAPQGEARSVPDTTLDCALRPTPRVGNLAGHVRHAGTHAGVGGVTVTLTPGAGITVAPGAAAPSVMTAVTGDDGSYQFQNLFSGSYGITVSAGPTTRGTTTPHAVDVRPRETANGDIEVAGVDASGINIRGGVVAVRESIHFQTDSAEILPDSNTLLERIADFLNRHPELARIEIQGHTDNQGTPAHNMTLSQNRAEAVRAALVNAGVGGERLTARGYGQTRPIGPNLTPAGRARNRRVVFQIAQRVPGAGAAPGGARRPGGLPH